jgi:hypothetical protein
LLKINGLATLDEAGDNYSATIHVKIFDADGTLVDTLSFPGEATRSHVETINWAGPHVLGRCRFAPRHTTVGRRPEWDLVSSHNTGSPTSIAATGSAPIAPYATTASAASGPFVLLRKNTPVIEAYTPTVSIFAPDDPVSTRISP